MTMVTELIGAISSSIRSVETEEQILDTYLSWLQELQEQVQAALQGGAAGVDEEMNDRIVATQQSVQKAIDSLEVAKDSLSRIQIQL